MGTRLSSSSAAVCLAVGLWVSCSPDSGTSAGSGGRRNTGGASGTGASTGTGGAAGSGGAGGLGTGGSSTGGSSTGGSSTGGSSTGGSGGTLTDASFPDVTFVYDAAGGSGGVTVDSACATASVEAKLEKQPADIIVAVDNSGSMNAEVAQVRQNMNAFSSQIIGSGIDVHVVLISNPSGAANGICIPAPLGSGACPNDSRSPNYLHIPIEVGSRDPLDKITTTFSQWRSMLRTNATKSFVVVTDDNSNTNAQAFTTAVNGLDAAMFQPGGWKFHAIFSFTHPDFLTCLAGGDLCCGFSANVGTVYRELVQLTGGVSGNLCQQDFKPVFDQLATAVTSGAQLLCEIPMPTSDAGIVDPRQVSLDFISRPGATPQRLGNVGSSNNCGNGGWYYNASPPTKIILCSSTCQAAQSVANPRINVLLGCLGS